MRPCVSGRVSECVCIRRFYCLYGDSMNVAARMSANAKESGVCVSPQIAAHLASTSASRSPRTLPQPRLPSFAPACLGSECASPAARCASAAAHTATDVPSDELPDAGSEAHASACTTPRLCVVSCVLCLVSCVARRASDLVASHRSSRSLSPMSRALPLI
jgi:hypothetical protein